MQIQVFWQKPTIGIDVLEGALEALDGRISILSDGAVQIHIISRNEIDHQANADARDLFLSALAEVREAVGELVRSILGDEQNFCRPLDALVLLDARVGSLPANKYIMLL